MTIQTTEEQTTDLYLSGEKAQEEKFQHKTSRRGKGKIPYENRSHIHIPYDKVNFEQLISLVHLNYPATRSRVTEDAVRNVLKTMVFVINEAMRNNIEVRLPKLGVFHSRFYAGTEKGINPRTGKPMKTEDRHVPTFTFAQTSRRRIRNEIAEQMKGKHEEEQGTPTTIGA